MSGFMMVAHSGKTSSFPSPTDFIVSSITEQRKDGILAPMDTPAGKDPQDQWVTLQLKHPSPHSLTATTG